MTEDDMKRFLLENNVREEHFGAALVLRTFLQMIELTPRRSQANNCAPSVALTSQVPVDDCSVKIEDTDSYDEMIEQDMYSDQDIRSRLSSIVTDSDEETCIERA